jgi:hypothetical protein
VIGLRSRERSSTESGSSTVPAAGLGSGGSSGSGTGGWTGKKAEEKIWTGYVEDSVWRVRDSFALLLTSGWTGRAILMLRR